MGEASDRTIRAATPQDESGVWPLARELATTSVLDRAVFTRMYATILADPAAALVVGTQDREIIGYVHVLRHPAFHADGDLAWVEELMVAPAHRSRGWGRALMAAAEHWAAGCGYVALATRRAAAFYTHLGYAESAAYLRKSLG